MAHARAEKRLRVQGPWERAEKCLGVQGPWERAEKRLGVQAIRSHLLVYLSTSICLPSFRTCGCVQLYPHVARILHLALHWPGDV